MGPAPRGGCLSPRAAAATLLVAVLCLCCIAPASPARATPGRRRTVDQLHPAAHRDAALPAASHVNVAPRPTPPRITTAGALAGLLTDPGNWTGTCEPCPPASYADRANASDCIRYDVADECRNITGLCPLPPHGYHGSGYTPPGGNQTLCSPCPADQYNDKFGQAECSYCEDGFEPTPNRTACVGCPAGMTTNSTVHTCSPCGPGNYTRPDSHLCEPCGDGTQPNSEHTKCDLCPIGTFSNSSTRGLCVSCSVAVPGWHSKVRGSSNCSACLPGFMSYDGKSCIQCKPDLYWNVTTKTCPKPCPLGSQCHMEDKYCQQCAQCNPGTFRDGSIDSCQPCAPGTYQDKPGKATCVKCPAGSYQDEHGQKLCKLCSKHEVCPAGSTAPKTCSPMFDIDNSSCKPSIKLIGIIAGSCVAFLAVLGVLVYTNVRRFWKRRSEEEQALLSDKARREPVYTGL